MEKRSTLIWGIYIILFTFSLVAMNLNAWGQVETPIYTTGFESSEEFTAGTTYNNTTVAYSGPLGQQWGTYYGTPSTTSPISDSQSLQMRWYTSAAENLGYTFTHFDLSSVTKVTFKAKNSNGINVAVSYSTNGGTTFVGESIISLSTSASEYTYNISPTGEFENVRIRFMMILPTTNPTSTSRLYIDDVVVYGMVTEPTLQVSTGLLSGFSYDFGFGPSAEQSFTVSGTNLTEDILVAPPANYEVSLTSGAGFVSNPANLTLTQDAGTVSPTTIYVRLKAGLGVGDYNDEDIDITSTGATAQAVTCSGSVETPDLINIAVGDTRSENFNGIGTDAAATLPVGWRVDKSTTVRQVGSFGSAGKTTEQQGGNDLASNAGNGIYNFGAGDAATATDRALGGLSSSSASKSVNAYVRLFNNGADPIDHFVVSYNVEKYRRGSNSAGFTIQMYYSNDGINWTSAGNDFRTIFNGDSDNTGYTPAPGMTVQLSNRVFNQALAVGENLYLAWNYSVTSGTTTSNAQALAIDNVSITANDASAVIPPSLTATPTPIAGLDYVVGDGPSDSKSFTVYGENLTGNIEITPPANFEISEQEAGPYGNTAIVLTPDVGVVTNTLIYARMVSGLSADSYSGNVAINSPGASASVSLSGRVVEAFAIPYSNDFRTTEVFELADIQGFTYSGVTHQTTAGGYILVPESGYIETPVIDFTTYDFLVLEFDVATFGGSGGQQFDVRVSVSANNGASFTTVYTAEPTSTTYATQTVYLDLRDVFNSPTGKIRFEMTGGSNQVRFRDLSIDPATANTVPDIATLRSMADVKSGPVIYSLTGEVVLTLQSAVYRNHKYIQDATGAILIDDAAGNITTAYNLGDGITGITGYLSSYNNMLQFVPVSDPGPASNTGLSVTPEVKTLSGLGTTDQAKLVTVYGVTFGVGGSFISPVNYTISDPGGSGVLRTHYSDLNYIGTAIPVTPKHITGVILQFGSQYQLIPRDLDDFATPVIVSITPVGIAGVPYGTPEDIAKNYLPGQTTIIDDGGIAHVVYLNWTLIDYDPYASEEYQAVANFTLPPGIAQSTPPTPLELETKLVVAIPIPLSSWALYIAMAAIIMVAVYFMRRKLVRS